MPVLGNGDVWESFDALRMMRATGCAGVIVGRGCLGRPWLFGELAEVFNGREPGPPPAFGEIVEVMMDHGQRLVEPVSLPRLVDELLRRAGERLAQLLLERTEPRPVVEAFVLQLSDAPLELAHQPQPTRRPDTVPSLR